MAKNARRRMLLILPTPVCADTARIRAKKFMRIMPAEFDLLAMPRKARFAPPGYWMHIVQRGHHAKPIFRHDDDRLAYLDLLAGYARDRQVQLLGYSLMPNHVHLIALGKYPRAIADWMRCLNGHYGQRMHSRQKVSGRFWQERYFSCTVDERHLRSALRYVEQNPLRGGLVTDAVRYPCPRPLTTPASCAPPAS